MNKSKNTIQNQLSDRLEAHLGFKPNELEKYLFQHLYKQDVSYQDFTNRLVVADSKSFPELHQEYVEGLELSEEYTCVFDIHTMNLNECHNTFIHPLNVIQKQGAQPIAQINTFFIDDESQNKLIQCIDAISSKQSETQKKSITVKNRLFFEQQFTHAGNCHVIAAGTLASDNFISTSSGQIGDTIWLINMQDVNYKIIQPLLKIKDLNVLKPIGNTGIFKSLLNIVNVPNATLIIHLDKVPETSTVMDSLQKDLAEFCILTLPKESECTLQNILQQQQLIAHFIGKIVTGEKLQFFWNEKLEAELPHTILNPALTFSLPDSKTPIPEYIIQNKQFDIHNIPNRNTSKLVEVAKQIVTMPNITCRRWMPSTANHIDLNLYSDATIAPIQYSDALLAISVGCNQRYVYGDHEIGTAIAVAEASRNIVCTGGVPSVVFPILKIGNTTESMNYKQLLQGIKGIEKTSKEMRLPIAGGNINFETISEESHAIPTVAVMGTMIDRALKTTFDFKHKGDTIYLIGTTREDISASEYLNACLNVKNYSAPYFDVHEEMNLQSIVAGLINEGLITSAHSVSAGGIFVNLIESGIPNELGFTIETDSEVRPDVFLFGESQSRVIVTVNKYNEKAFMDFMEISTVPVLLLGHVTRGKIVIDDVSFGDINDYKSIYGTL